MQTRRKSEVTIETREVTVIRLRESSPDVIDVIQLRPTKVCIEKQLQVANRSEHLVTMTLRSAIRALSVFLAVLADRKRR